MASNDPLQDAVETGITQAFIDAMGGVATGVTVVATDGDAGRFAQTVSAMCSVSAEPPLVLICLHGRSPANDAIVETGVFCVNVLATQHDHVADTFAGRPWPGKEPWDFTCGHWGVAKSGSPKIHDAIASFDCEVHEVVAAGTHKVYIGRVKDVEVEEGVPLIYSSRLYHRPVVHEPSVFEEFPDAYPTYLNKENEK